MLICAGGHCIHAQKKTQQVPDGVFFKIEGKGLKQPSYALGTMHYVHGDVMHDVPGLDSILNTITCLATELSMDAILHPETVETAPNLKLTRSDSIKANSMLPEIFEDFADTSQPDAYTRTLTPEQLDSLDKAMQYLQVDDVIRRMAEMQGQPVGEGKIYRTANPITLIQLMQALSVTQAAKYYTERGYSMDYQQIDHKIMLTVNAMNEQRAKDKAAGKAGKDTESIYCVGLDSTYAYRQMQESSTTIKDLLNDLTTEHLARLVYNGAINFYRVGTTFEACEPLYRTGHGKEVVQAMANIETRVYNNDLLGDGRNRYWMTQLPALMSKHSTLIAVGLAHLLPTANSEGVLSMLQKKGYKITKIL